MMKWADIMQPSGHHVVAKCESDFKEFVNQFHLKGKVFCFTEGREYDKFPKFDHNVLSSINFNVLSSISMTGLMNIKGSLMINKLGLDFGLKHVPSETTVSC